jgi:hypothetical protein
VRSPGEAGPGAPDSQRESFWLAAGLHPKAAQALAAAGLAALVDLVGISRAELRAIPGLGRASLAILGELLGWPWPSGRAPSPEELWRRRGLPPQAAVTFAQIGMTLRHLKLIAREDLRTLPRVGPKAVRACEHLLGRPLPSHRPLDPVAAAWRSRGLPTKAARVLSKAGLACPQDLRSSSREDLLALPGIGPILLRQLEALLGDGIPSRASYWLSHRLSLYIANALVRAEIQSIADLAALSRKQFLALPGLGLYALAQCEKKLGLRLPSL